MSIQQLLIKGLQEDSNEPALMLSGNMDSLIFGYPFRLIGKSDMYIKSESNYAIWGQLHGREYEKLKSFIDVEKVKLWPEKIEWPIYFPVQSTIIIPYNIDKIINNLGKDTGIDFIKKQLLETKNKYSKKANKYLTLK
jgi:hypothetical protein